MKRFMVAVNNKYIVMVESTSNLGAEHMILDNIKGSKTALAFDIEDGETATDMFAHFLNTCDTISYDELVKKDVTATIKQIEWLNKRFEEINEMLATVEDWKKEKAMLEVRITAAENAIMQLGETCEEHARKYGLANRWIRPDEIDELLARIAPAA